MNDGSLRTCAELLGRLEPTGSSSRTSPVYEVLTVGTLWPELFRRWPATGSVRSGQVFGRPTLVPRMDACAGSVLPTPRAQNGESRNMNCWVRPLDQPQNLENAIGHLLNTLVTTFFNSDPTPTPSPDGNPSSDDPHPTPPTTSDD